MNPRCLKDKVCQEVIIRLLESNIMVTIRGWIKQFQTKGDFGLCETFFFNDLVGFPSRKKSKAIYEGMTIRKYQGVPRNAKKY